MPAITPLDDDVAPEAALVGGAEVESAPQRDDDDKGAVAADSECNGAAHPADTDAGSGGSDTDDDEIGPDVDVDVDTEPEDEPEPEPTPASDRPGTTDGAGDGASDADNESARPGTPEMPSGDALDSLAANMADAVIRSFREYVTSPDDPLHVASAPPLSSDLHSRETASSILAHVVSGEDDYLLIRGVVAMAVHSAEKRVVDVLNSDTGGDAASKLETYIASVSNEAVAMVAVAHSAGRDAFAQSKPEGDEYTELCEHVFAEILYGVLVPHVSVTIAMNKSPTLIGVIITQIIASATQTATTVNVGKTDILEASMAADLPLRVYTSSTLDTLYSCSDSGSADAGADGAAADDAADDDTVSEVTDVAVEEGSDTDDGEDSAPQSPPVFTWSELLYDVETPYETPGSCLRTRLLNAYYVPQGAVIAGLLKERVPPGIVLTRTCNPALEGCISPAVTLSWYLTTVCRSVLFGGRAAERALFKGYREKDVAKRRACPLGYYRIGSLAQPLDVTPLGVLYPTVGEVRPKLGRPAGGKRKRKRGRKRHGKGKGKDKAAREDGGDGEAVAAAAPGTETEDSGGGSSTAEEHETAATAATEPEAPKTPAYDHAAAQKQAAYDLALAFLEGGSVHDRILALARASTVDPAKPDEAGPPPTPMAFLDPASVFVRLPRQVQVHYTCELLMHVAREHVEAARDAGVEPLITLPRASFMVRRYVDRVNEGAVPDGVQGLEVTYTARLRKYGIVPAADDDDGAGTAAASDNTAGRGLTVAELKYWLVESKDDDALEAAREMLDDEQFEGTEEEKDAEAKRRVDGINAAMEKLTKTKLPEERDTDDIYEDDLKSEDDVVHARALAAVYRVALIES